MLFAHFSFYLNILQKYNFKGIFFQTRYFTWRPFFMNHEKLNQCILLISYLNTVVNAYFNFGHYFIYLFTYICFVCLCILCIALLVYHIDLQWVLVQRILFFDAIWQTDDKCVKYKYWLCLSIRLPHNPYTRIFNTYWYKFSRLTDALH